MIIDVTLDGLNQIKEENRLTLGRINNKIPDFSAKLKSMNEKTVFPFQVKPKIKS